MCHINFLSAAITILLSTIESGTVMICSYPVSLLISSTASLTSWDPLSVRIWGGGLYCPKWCNNKSYTCFTEVSLIFHNSTNIAVTQLDLIETLLVAPVRLKYLLLCLVTYSFQIILQSICPSSTRIIFSKGQFEYRSRVS